MKGMDKIKRGKGFRGLLNYLFRSAARKINDKTIFEEQSGRLIGGNMIAKDPRNLAREFGITRNQRKDIEKPVWHNSLRLPHGEKISDEKWVEIADEYMIEMGFDPELHMRSYVMHDDEKGQHIHIIASRVSVDGGLYLGQNENLKSTRIIGQLEQKHGLVRTPQRKKGQNSDRKDRIPPTRNEAAEAAREGRPPHRTVIQDAIDDLTKESLDAVDFIIELEKQGITARPSFFKDGRMRGFGLEYANTPFKASDLGRLYSWTRLQKHVLYDINTHEALLRSYASDLDTAPLKALKEKDNDRIRKEIAANEARATELREQQQQQQRELEQQLASAREHKERDAKRIQAATAAATAIATRVAASRKSATSTATRASAVKRTYQSITERARSIYSSFSRSLSSLVTRAKQSAHRRAKPATDIVTAFAAHVEKMQQAESQHELDLVALLDAHIKQKANLIDFNYYDNEPINFLHDLIDAAGLEQPTDAELSIYIEQHTDALNALVNEAEQALNIERPK